MRTLLAAACLAAAGCTTFQDPSIVVDLRVLAMRSEPPDQVIDVDLAQPAMPADLLAQLVPTEVCALVADPGMDRRLAWSMTMCPPSDDNRCDGDRPQVALGGGLLDDPERTVPEPSLCVTVMPDAGLVAVLLDVLQRDPLRGLGGLDYAVELRIGGQDADRDLDEYATKTLRVSPRITPAAAANENPRIDRIEATIDAMIGDAAPVALPLGRCRENPAPYPLPPGTRLRLLPIEPDGVREGYVLPTLDGRIESFTESLTYQWVASAGGYSSGSTGGPRDLAGNPAPLFSDYESPATSDLDGPTDVSLWIIQRDERLGVQWYESCIHVE